MRMIQPSLRRFYQGRELTSARKVPGNGVFTTFKLSVATVIIASVELAPCNLAIIAEGYRVRYTPSPHKPSPALIPSAVIAAARSQEVKWYKTLGTS